MKHRRTKQLFSPSKVATLFNLELKRRPRPPRRVARTTMFYWINGEKTPNYLMLEYLAEHSTEERVRQTAKELLAHFDKQDKAE